MQYKQNSWFFILVLLRMLDHHF